MTVTVFDAVFSTYASGTSGLTSNNWTDVQSDGYTVTGGNLVTSSSATFPPIKLLRRPTTEKYTNQIIDLYFTATLGADITCELKLTDDNLQCYYFDVSTTSPGSGSIYRVSGGNTLTNIVTGTNFSSTIVSGRAYKATCSAIKTGSTTTLNFVVVDQVTGSTVLNITGTDSTAALQGTGGYAISHYSGPFTISRITTFQNDTVTTVAINDASVKSSPYNWEFNGSTWIQSNVPGAYQRFTLSSSTYLSVVVDPSALSAQGLSAGQYPWIGCVINNKLVTTQLTSSSSEIFLATGLSIGTSYDAYIYFYKTGLDTADKWSTSGYNSVRITGYKTDGTVSASTAKSKNAVFFGDSITEGNAIGDAIQTFAHFAGVALGWEFGQIGFGSQGWSKTGDGSVPNFQNAWNLMRSGVSRSFSPAPDYVVICQGTNDYLNGGTGTSPVSDSTVQTAVTATLTAIRSALPSTKIFVIIPFGQFKVSPITAGFNAVADSNMYLIDLGTSYSKGLTGFTSSNLFTSDGIHPSLWNTGRLGSTVTQAIQAKLATKTPRQIRV